MLRFNGLFVLQRRNEYQIFLPNQVHIAGLVTPPDDEFISDSRLLDAVTKAIASRYKIKP